VWVQRVERRAACGMRHGYVVEGIWTVASGLSGRGESDASLERRSDRSRGWARVDAMGRDVDGAVAIRALAAKSGVLDDR
jgi:hypothetical protein